jgi:peptide/nickel transport system permease protein
MWRLTWRRFLRSRLATAALLYVLLMAVIALLAPLIANRKPLVQRTVDGLRFPAFADYVVDDPDMDSPVQGTTIVPALVPFSPNTVDLPQRLQGPGREHLLGTDDLGRDIFARLIHGARVSLAVGFLATAIALIIGSFLGAIAGYYGGSADWIVSRVIEVVLCFPFLFLVLGIVALFKPSIFTLMIALGLTSWTSEARYVRGEFLRIRELEPRRPHARAARVTRGSSSATSCRTHSRRCSSPRVLAWPSRSSPSPHSPSSASACRCRPRRGAACSPRRTSTSSTRGG